MKFFKPPIVLFFLIVVFFGLLIYSNSFDADFTFDSTALVANPKLRNIDVLNRDFLQNRSRTDQRRYITFLSFAINYMLHGSNPFGYHVVNFLIHLLNVLLVWWLAYMLGMIVCSRWKSSQNVMLWSFFAAMLFLVHPIQTQAVTYLYQRLAAIVTVFYLLSVCFYVKARVLFQSKKTGLPFFVLSGAAFILGMFSKENIFTLPVTLIVIEGCFFQPEQFWKRKKFWMWGVGVALIIFMAAIIFAGVSTAPSATSYRLSNDHLPVTSYTYFLTQMRVILKYWQLIIFPVGQSLDHDMPLSQTITHLPTLLSGIVVACVFVLGALIVRRRRLIGFGILWFFITAAVECSIVPIRHVIFEHRMYLPMVGLVISFSAWIFTQFSKKQAVTVMCILVVAFGYVTYERNKIWATKVSLWKDVIAKAPLQSRGYDNLGNAYMALHQPEKALSYFRKAVRLDPLNAETYNNIGLIRFKKGQYDLAKKYFDKSLEINPEYAIAYNNLGTLFLQQDNDVQAEKVFLKAMLYAPEQISAKMNMANIYMKRNDAQRAVAMYEAVLHIDSRYKPALLALLKIDLKQKNQSGVNKIASTLFELPMTSEELLACGSVLAQEGQFKWAQKFYNRAVKQSPSNYLVYLELGKFWGNYNFFDQAVAVWEQGKKRTPAMADEFDILIGQARRLQMGL